MGSIINVIKTDYIQHNLNSVKNFILDIKWKRFESSTPRLIMHVLLVEGLMNEVKTDFEQHILFSNFWDSGCVGSIPTACKTFFKYIINYISL